MKLISAENYNMNINNYCYCILQYVKNHCVVGYLLVYHNSMDYFNVSHSQIHTYLKASSDLRLPCYEGVAV